VKGVLWQGAALGRRIGVTRGKNERRITFCPRSPASDSFDGAWEAPAALFFYSLNQTFMVTFV
jgi:hypothetical protein